jgi:hypothetical protein
VVQGVPRHQVELDSLPLAARYGDEVTLIEWRERLDCSACGSWSIVSLPGISRRATWG